LDRKGFLVRFCPNNTSATAAVPAALHRRAINLRGKWPLRMRCAASNACDGIFSAVWRVARRGGGGRFMAAVRCAGASGGSADPGFRFA